MPHGTGYASNAALLGALAVPVLFACAGNDAPRDVRGPGAGDGAATGGAAGRNPSQRDGGQTANTGGASMSGSGGGAACNANRAAGIPINSGTVSASVDSQTMSGSATILWAAGANKLSLDSMDGSTLTIVFPGCEAKSYRIPSAGTPPDAISITYTGGGGEPQWACTYEDSDPGAASCTIDVTAYGDQRNAPVTGTFSGVMRLRSGSGASTVTVSAGTFTFGRP
jgi:hypothetical protein